MLSESPAPLLAALRLWDDRLPARDGAWNMAVDEALLTSRPGAAGPVLRVYRWDRPTLSFGYFLPEAQAQAARQPGEAMVRRWTGGGLVHHAGAFTWTLVVPQGEAFCRVRPAESYAQLHGALARALSVAGLGPVSVVPAASAAPTGGLCAEAPAPGDVLRRGRKFAGAGQRRTREGLLHQGVLFLPEAQLPADFPVQLAAALAGEVTLFRAEWAAPAPVARYSDPAWNARR